MVTPLPRILVLFAHPAPQHSRLQSRLYRRALAVSGVTGRDLYELYPDFDVDVPAEQQLLLAHDRHEAGARELDPGDGVTCHAVCFSPGLAP